MELIYKVAYFFVCVQMFFWQMRLWRVHTLFPPPPLAALLKFQNIAIPNSKSVWQPASRVSRLMTLATARLMQRQSSIGAGSK